jgi:hypothetical protein
MKRLLHHERLRQRRETNAARRLEARTAAAAHDCPDFGSDDRRPAVVVVEDVGGTHTVGGGGNGTYPARTLTDRMNEITADMIEHGDITQILEED